MSLQGTFDSSCDSAEASADDDDLNPSFGIVGYRRRHCFYNNNIAIILLEDCVCMCVCVGVGKGGMVWYGMVWVVWYSLDTIRYDTI